MNNAENGVEQWSMLDDLGIKFVQIGDQGFPLSLARITDAPKKLYYIGDIALLNEANNIAIVPQIYGLIPVFNSIWFFRLLKSKLNSSF